MPYIGKTTDGFGVRNRFVYLASSGDTSVSGADANGATLTFTDGAYVDVYLNGVLLKPTTDYNTSTANTIAGLSALNTNDEVTVVVYDVFTVADMVSATSGGTFSGNVTVNGDITVGDDIILNSDSAALQFGADSEITLTHSADAGLLLKHANTADDKYPVLTLQTGDTDIATDDILGKVQFQAPNEATGTDAQVIAAGIWAYSEGDFSSSNNATSLSFQVAESGTAAERLRIFSNGAVRTTGQPRLSVYQYSAQTIAHNTYTMLKLDGTDRISNGMVNFTQSNTHTRWTAAQGGDYRISASMRWYTSSAISTSVLYIRKNGSVITFGYSHSLPNFEQLHVDGVFALSAGDYLEAQVYQYSGGDVAMNGGSDNLVHLSANLIA